MLNEDQLPKPIGQAIKAAYEKHREGLLTSEQLDLVVRMLRLMAIIAGQQPKR